MNVLVKAMVVAVACAMFINMVDSAPMVKRESSSEESEEREYGPIRKERSRLGKRSPLPPEYDYWGSPMVERESESEESEEREHGPIRKERIGPMEERQLPWKRSPLPPDYDFENMIPPAKREAWYPAKRSPLPPGFNLDQMKGFDQSDLGFLQNMIPPAKRSSPPFDYAKVRQNHLTPLEGPSPTSKASVKSEIA